MVHWALAPPECATCSNEHNKSGGLQHDHNKSVPGVTAHLWQVAVSRQVLCFVNMNSSRFDNQGVHVCVHEYKLHVPTEHNSTSVSGHASMSTAIKL